MAPKKRPAESIDLTDDSPFYSSQPNANASSSQGYAQSAQSSPHGRAPKQARTASGAPQDPVYVDDDDEEDVSATQGFTEHEYSWTLYGIMHGKVVGCRYYNGYATVGEMVVVRREPNNAYDSRSTSLR
jgi:SWI/SNF-related matrix-associated actin-dependent regulator of chromatin subfamily A3